MAECPHCGRDLFTPCAATYPCDACNPGYERTYTSPGPKSTTPGRFVADGVACCDAAEKLERIREAARELCDQAASAMQVDDTGGPTFFLADALEALRKEIES